MGANKYVIATTGFTAVGYSKGCRQKANAFIDFGVGDTDATGFVANDIGDDFAFRATTG